jgi:serine kinase of HPr protein (carbohydrate metabolism regulator)
MSGVSAVAIGARALLIEGPSSSGKSSLALALIDRGAALIGDDGVEISQDGAHIIVNPPPNIAGKIEIRHVGIADVPAVSARLALIISLDPSAPRYVEKAATCKLLDGTIPAITLAPHDPTLPLRAEWALAMHGLDTSD